MLFGFGAFWPMHIGQWDPFVRGLIQDAKAGDHAARSERLSRALGKPHQTQNTVIAAMVEMADPEAGPTQRFIDLLGEQLAGLD